MVRADIFQVLWRFFNSELRFTSILQCKQIFRQIFQISGHHPEPVDGRNGFELIQEYAAIQERSNPPPRQTAGQRLNHKENWA